MDWAVSIAVCAFAVAAVQTWRMRKLKKDVYEFTDSLEHNLDAVIQGEKPEPSGEMEDSLLGRVNEKLERTAHILEQKEQEIRENKEEMKELISDISHQTKTPIANQKIYLEILKSRPLPEEEMGFVEKLEHQTDRLDFLFKSMVKMSRLETGVIQIRKENGDLMETIGRAVSAVVPSAEKKKLRLSVEADGESVLPHDRKWTEEAVYNLLDNSVKYTESGGSIVIRLRKGEIFTEIHVEDTGKGIALDRQAQIFTRFYREPEVHDKEGVGIGLYLTRKIVQLQNGYVEVRSDVGKGADFCIFLPNA